MFGEHPKPQPFFTMCKGDQVALSEHSVGPDCPWSWVRCGHPTSLWNACSVLLWPGAVEGTGLDGPSYQVEGMASFQPGSLFCPPPPVPHPQHAC